MKHITLVLLVTAFALLLKSDAAAQRRIPHYQRTPKVSPYTTLFRADNGGLNSFIGNYTPTQRLREFESNTNREFFYQQRAVEQEAYRLSQEIAVAADQPSQQQGLVLRPTSTIGNRNVRTAGSFLQHSQFYPNLPNRNGINNSGRPGGRRSPMPRSGGIRLQR